MGDKQANGSFPGTAALNWHSWVWVTCLTNSSCCLAITLTFNSTFNEVPHRHNKTEREIKQNKTQNTTGRSETSKKNKNKNTSTIDSYPCTLLNWSVFLCWYYTIRYNEMYERLLLVRKSIKTKRAGIKIYWVEKTATQHSYHHNVGFNVY